MEKRHVIYGYDTCVCCGEVIPEGQMVCDNCKEKVGLNSKADTYPGSTHKPPKPKEITKKQEDK